jgi:pimeloyl-ACP methyl ester carboxylesterase
MLSDAIRLPSMLTSDLDGLARLEDASTRITTPCGDGELMWHSWGQGPALVLLHGGSGSWRHWARTIPAFAGQWRVLAPDHPGLGESALPPAPYSPFSMAAIIAQGLETLLAPGERYDLVGFSFGGLIAGHLAAQHGDRVRTLTINGSGGLGVARMPTPLEKVRNKTGAERVEAHRTNLARLMIHDVARIDALALAIQGWNSDHARLDSRQFALTMTLSEAITAATAPLNAIWGERDATGWPHIEDRRTALQALRPAVDFRIVPGAGHWTAYEAPEPFNAILREFLERG